MAVLYSYVCFEEGCKHKWDDWKEVNANGASSCPSCGSSNTGRNYYAEKKSVRGDIEPGFNRSTGIKYSGRKDLFTKMKAAGFGSVAHGGGIVPADTRYYGEEQYREQVQHAGLVDQSYLEMLQKGVEDSRGEQEDYKRPQLMRKPMGVAIPGLED